MLKESVIAEIKIPPEVSYETLYEISRKTKALHKEHLAKLREIGCETCILNFTHSMAVLTCLSCGEFQMTVSEGYTDGQFHYNSACVNPDCNDFYPKWHARQKSA